MDNSEANAISKASYMAGVLDERNEWYKKINKKIEELTKQIEEKEERTDGLCITIGEDTARKILKELI